MVESKGNEQLIICGGCNAKIGPGHLSEILGGIPKKFDENLLIGYESSDDAAVYKLTEDLAIIQTLDFFPTMVSDPYLFGQIAATNALSDVFAMGGKVVSALNIVTFPEEKNISVLGEILRGGAEKVHEAGGVLSGGHSIHDSTPKYGLSVTGIIHPDKILANNSCQLGDYLVLTKPLGVTLVTTAYSVGEISEAAFQDAVKSMTTLNKYAAEVANHFPVSSCTDVTGFGLLGHIYEMIDGRFSVEIDSLNIPIVEGAYQAAEEFLTTAGGQRNRNYLEDKVDFQQDDFALEEILFDPQTSGGLLMSIDEAHKDAFVAALEAAGVLAAVVGQVVEKGSKPIVVK